MYSDQVVVVGAGPTGLALASELALAGIPCTVLERRAARSQDSRAICLHARSTETLDLRGLADRFVKAGLPAPTFPLGPRGSGIDFRRLHSDFPYILNMPQSQMEDLLEERALELGARIRRSTKVVGLTQDADGVEVTLEDGNVERAAYVVGCDGLRSTVRELLGIEFPGHPNPGSVGLADVHLDGLPMDDAYGELTDTGLLLVFPFRDGSCRVVLYDYARAEVPVGEPMDLDEVRTSLRRITGRNLGPRDMSWSSRYRSESRQATVYRAGRVFLAGDAAHTHSPAGAQGLNTGLQDAYNLGWKLAATMGGRAPGWLLDTYHDERHPVGADVLRLTGRQFRLNVARTRWRRLLRSAVYRLVVPLPPVQEWLAREYSGVSVRYQTAPGHPLAGRRLPPGRLDGSTLHELFHDGRFVLLMAGLGGDSLEGLSEHVRQVSYSGGARGWPGAVLVRPDGYVAWAADDPTPETVRAAVARWLMPA